MNQTRHPLTPEALPTIRATGDSEAYKSLCDLLLWLGGMPQVLESVFESDAIFEPVRAKIAELEEMAGIPAGVCVLYVRKDGCLVGENDDDEEVEILGPTR